VYTKTMKRNSRFSKWSTCVCFSCRVYYETGTNMLNYHELPGIQQVFPGKKTGTKSVK